MTRTVKGMPETDRRAEIREFLRRRRDRITPEQVGLPVRGGKRRVKGLRREEVAMLAEVSVDYYIRMERGSVGGASAAVLEAIARALHLDGAERDHLFTVARENSSSTRSRRPTASQKALKPAVVQLLDAIVDAPAWIRNGHHDIAAMNPMARALYAPVLADPRRPFGFRHVINTNTAGVECGETRYGTTRNCAGRRTMPCSMRSPSPRRMASRSPRRSRRRSLP